MRKKFFKFNEFLLRGEYDQLASPVVKHQDLPAVAGDADPTFIKNSPTSFPAKALAKRVGQMDSTSIPAASIRVIILSAYKRKPRISKDELEGGRRKLQWR